MIDAARPKFGYFRLDGVKFARLLQATSQDGVPPDDARDLRRFRLLELDHVVNDVDGQGPLHDGELHRSRSGPGGGDGGGVDRQQVRQEVPGPVDQFVAPADGDGSPPLRVDGEGRVVERAGVVS